MINQHRDIEASIESADVLAHIVQRYCMLFTKEAVSNYISDTTVYVKLIDCLRILLKRNSQLNGD